MVKIIKRIVPLLLAIAVLLSSMTLVSAGFEDFTDVSGHWAGNTLRKAYEDGLAEGYDGRMYPDKPITKAEMLALLCRVLGASQEADISSNTSIPAGAWYYPYIARAVYLKLITAGETGFDAPVTRADAFALISAAFQLTEPKPDMDALSVYPDASGVTGLKRAQIASLVSSGLVSGYDGRLNLQSSMTRAEIFTLLYKIAATQDNALEPSGYVGGALSRYDGNIETSSFDGGLWLGCGAADVNLAGVVADRVTLRGHSLDALSVDGGSDIGLIIMAAQSGDTDFDGGALGVKTLRVGDGGGTVTASNTANVEVTGRGRYVVISDGTAESITVSGAWNTLVIKRGVEVDSLELTSLAADCLVIIEGKVASLRVEGSRSSLEGRGSVGTFTRTRHDTSVAATLRIGDTVEEIDPGIADAQLTLTVPSVLEAGATLTASAVLSGADPDRELSGTWYIDGQAVSRFTAVSGGVLPPVTHDFSYTQDMSNTAIVRLVITHITNSQEEQTLTAESSVWLENYNSEHYKWYYYEEANALVSPAGYKGDFTTQWALDNDLTALQKESFVNVRGYSSGTEYLLWVNLAFQRVNIFEGSSGNWRLIRECLVGTGKPGSGTPVGVYKTTYKQTGWFTGSYTVRPVVRFRLGTGYAFHSRLYYPGNSDVLKDASIGYPISLGCVRMYDEDVQYIYDFMPDGTTVVVY